MLARVAGRLARPFSMRTVCFSTSSGSGAKSGPHDFSSKLVCHKLKAGAVQSSNAAFVAPSAELMGAVTLGKDSSVFYGSILVH
jgi:hypothetical protein